MERQNYLGIYISSTAATVVCLGGQGRDRKILGCFSVSIDQQQERDLPALAGLIANGCAERELKFSEAAVGLDCAMFMQHNVHSEFSDARQIAQTVRFDTEEALAMDISNVAIAFTVTSSTESGSELAVFTAQHKVLSDVIVSLQNNNIDPVAVEPDVNGLARFVCQDVSADEGEPGGTFFSLLSDSNSYFIVRPAEAKSSTSSAVMMRTLLVGSRQSRTELLAREVPVTAALAETGVPINYLKVFDSTNSVNYQQLSKKLSINTDVIDLASLAGADPEMLADCDDKIGFAIAYGAALYNLEKLRSINFRNDFMPYQGKKIRLQKTLKFISICVTIVLLSLGLRFQLKLFQENRPRRLLRNKLNKQYSVVMFGKKPKSGDNPVRKLKSEYNRVKNVKSGQLTATGGKSVPAKLTLVLKAFNECAAKTDLKIDSISIGTKSVRISGNTSSRKNTLMMRKTLESNKLKVSGAGSLEMKGGRDVFNITIVP